MEKFVAVALMIRWWVFGVTIILCLVAVHKLWKMPRREEFSREQDFKFYHAKWYVGMKRLTLVMYAFVILFGIVSGLKSSP